MMRVAVTGSTGFVGRHVVKELVNAGHAVCGLGGPGDGMDVRDAKRFGSCFREFSPEAVIHLAALSSVRASWEVPALAVAINVVGTVNVWEAARQAGTQRFVFASSSEVYGSGKDVHIEGERPDPLSPYAASKYAAELLLTQLEALGEMETVILRPFNHIGPGQSQHFAIPSFARQLWAIKENGQSQLLAGNVDVSRDFLDVRDVARAYRKAVEQPGLRGIFNVCSGLNRDLREVINHMAAWLGIATPVEIVCEEERVRASDIPIMRGSPKKFTEATGWEPLIPFRDTLADILGDTAPGTTPGAFKRSVR